jgi:AMP-polyphosphate phosphotransferase
VDLDIKKINLSDYESGAKYDGDYGHRLEKLQKKLFEQQALHILHDARTLIIFEGWDGSGKGGAIKRLTANWDPRYFQVYPIGAPSQDEKDRHFLWRFWSKIPATREITILDRSHYGRVLVERVEGFCSETQWRRGYDEINEFESQQVEIGTNVIKIFLHVTQESQDKVLVKRMENPAKRWKITPEDFRNRARREDYLTAMHEMFVQTDTRWAPWTVIDGNNQKSARIAVLEHVLASMKSHVPQEFPEVNADVAELAKKVFG